jgi:cell division protein FtsN
MNKGQTRSADQDAAEEKRNKDWDPNAPLYGKKAAKSGDADGASEIKPEPPVETKAPDRKPDAASRVDPKSADPLGDLAKAKTAEPKVVDAKPLEAKPAEAKPAEPKPVTDPFIYFVQAGAYRTADEAEAQRAKLALLGLDAKLSERDQGGRTVHRVRVGPMDKADAERVRAKLEAAHLDSAMVRVQR